MTKSDFTNDELREIDMIIEGDLDFSNATRELNDKLYEFYMEDMPYGTAKARDGDPDEFIMKHLEEDFG